MKRSLSFKLVVLASAGVMSSLSFSTSSFAYPNPCLDQAVKVCRAYLEVGEITEDEYQACVTRERAECEALNGDEPDALSWRSPYLPVISPSVNA